MLTKVPTAKALQKIKHIKHVKQAIKYHEALRARRDTEFKEDFDRRQRERAKRDYDARYTRGDVKNARRNYREDWAMGPLRPNRAVGINAELYGAMGRDQMQYPQIHIESQKMKNKLREKAGLDPEWPIIVDDKMVYPIAKNDRVVVIRGKEMNTIGVVQEIHEESHMVQLKDVNKVYVDSSIFTLASQEADSPKRAIDFPIPINDLRLVVPMTVTEIRDGRPVNVQQDVIVDNVVLEKYTEGVDPYIGARARSNTIPDEHQLDPRTKNPIYHRYIAGTRQLIEWPSDSSVEETSSPEEEVEIDTPSKWNPLNLIKGRSKPAVLESGIFSRSKAEAPEVPEEEAYEESPRESLYKPGGIQREPLLPRPSTYSRPHGKSSHPNQASTHENVSLEELNYPDSSDNLSDPAEIEDTRQVTETPAVQLKPRITKTPQQVIWDMEAEKRGAGKDGKNPFVHHNQTAYIPPSVLQVIGMHMEKNGIKLTSGTSAESKLD
ncbi:hypothetical protein K504DRAFT_537787 [Pleomassaria siparia CBS 279.74]|uniref:KOW domain-containing protein n=1 Tax=Pleomassaria siparia CBS 279.74 TaxID=1314801 RepID=A0A6G1JVZ1_9PLEO|nr:hypothetical protein K504DRAFT_537787 [Pleomassaria siparia CBS 279.74]